MTEQRKHEDLTGRARELFDDSVERLDAATLSKLNRGRHRALTELENAKPRGVWLRWAPATAVAAAAVVTVMFMNGPQQAVVVAPVTASDFEMLLEADSLEMFEDLEFYSWLETAELEEDGDVG